MFFHFIAGDTQPIASQIIELAKKGLSSDNISVIVVFFKDPKQIISEYTAMEYESTNGCHQLADAELLVHHHGDANAGIVPTPLSVDSHFVTDIDEFKMHVDALKHDASHDQPSQLRPDFLFGTGGGSVGGGENGDDAEYHTIVTTTEITTTSNGNGKLLANEFDDDDEQHDDFGPETDVDATDDAAISPLSPVDQTDDILAYNELNANAANNFSAGIGYDFIEKVAENPIGIVSAVVHETDDIVDELVKKDADSDDAVAAADADHFHAHVDLHANHQYDDNRFLEDAAARGVGGLIDVAERAAHDRDDHDDDDGEPELRNKIDFSEKKEYSFEREDFEKELNPIGDMPAELMAISKEVMAAASNEKERNDYERDEDDDDDDDYDDDDDARLPPNLEAVVGEIITTAEQHGKCIRCIQFPIRASRIATAEMGKESGDGGRGQKSLPQRISVHSISHFA